MIVQCVKCQQSFDDEFRTTICPHETFAANDGQNNFAHHPESYLGPLKALLALAMLLFPALAFAQVDAGGGAYNAVATCTRPANTTSYGSGAITKLFGCQVSGSTAAALMTVGGVQAGPNIITGARISTNGTGATAATYKVYLFSGPPTLTGLSDQSTYLGPFAADLPNYIGALACATMTPTTDATAQFYGECSTSNLAGSYMQFQGSPGATFSAMIEVTTAYTPISAETITLRLATAPYQ